MRTGLKSRVMDDSGKQGPAPLSQQVVLDRLQQIDYVCGTDKIEEDSSGQAGDDLIQRS